MCRREEKEQNWTEWETGLPSRTKDSPNDPPGSSGAGMALRKCPDLNWDSHALFSPSLVIISFCIWAAPWKGEVRVGGVLSAAAAITEGSEGQRSVSTAFITSRKNVPSLIGTWAACYFVPWSSLYLWAGPWPPETHDVLLRYALGTSHQPVFPCSTIS